MDQSSSNIRNNQNQNRPVPPSQLLSSSSSLSSANDRDLSGLPRRIPPPPPPPPNFHSQYRQLGSRPNNQNHGLAQFHASSSQAVPATFRPPFVNHWKVVTLRMWVKLHRQTIRLEVDEQKPDTHLVTFTFDAAVHGRITIFYFAKEGTSCRFSPSYSDKFRPVTASFQKGMNQKFRQPIRTGIDLGSFLPEDLAKPTSDDVFPLVIYAEARSPPLPTDEQLWQPPAPGNAQITLAVIEKKNGEPFQVKVDRQLVLVDGVRHEYREIFGIEKSAEKACIICSSKPKDTVLLPCRHLWMCSECAKEALKFRTDSCPLCRQPVKELFKI